jgi:hypothetical protein
MMLLASGEVQEGMHAGGARLGGTVGWREGCRMIELGWTHRPASGSGG